MENWQLMWVTALGIFATCKWLTCRQVPQGSIPCGRKIAYCMFWPGMDSAAFLTKSPRRLATAGEWCFALGKTIFGLVLLLGVAPMARHWPEYLRGWAAMVGVVFTMHFGFFHLLSCFWRRRGYEAVALMQAPYLSGDLAEFWGKRWNLAFRDLTHRFLFRPLSKRFSPMVAMFLVFGGSGVVHDLVITVPARAGYGGPTVYFLLQAFGMLVERQRWFAKRSRLRRVFCWLVLLAPVPLLFPPAFVHRVILPMVMDFHEALRFLLGW